MVLLKEAARLCSDVPPLEGLDAPNLKSLIAATVHDYIVKERKGKCRACIATEGLPRGEEQRDDAMEHSCKTYSVVNPIEWRTALNHLKHKKAVEAYLMNTEKVSVPQVVNLPVGEFIEKNSKEIYDQVCELFKSGNCRA